MKNFKVVIEVELNSGILTTDSLTIKADNFYHAYEIACDLVSSYFSDDFSYSFLEIRRI